MLGVVGAVLSLLALLVLEVQAVVALDQQPLAQLLEPLIRVVVAEAPALMHQIQREQQAVQVL